MRILHALHSLLLATATPARGMSRCLPTVTACIACAWANGACSLTWHEPGAVRIHRIDNRGQAY